MRHNKRDYIYIYIYIYSLLERSKKSETLIKQFYEMKP